jgi:hypothetical protein
MRILGRWSQVRRVLLEWGARYRNASDWRIVLIDLPDGWLSEVAISSRSAGFAMRQFFASMDVRLTGARAPFPAPVSQHR